MREQVAAVDGVTSVGGLGGHPTRRARYPETGPGDLTDVTVFGYRSHPTVCRNHRRRARSMQIDRSSGTACRRATC